MKPPIRQVGMLANWIKLARERANWIKLVKERAVWIELAKERAYWITVNWLFKKQLNQSSQYWIRLAKLFLVNNIWHCILSV
jgi:hypothetical protein